MQRMLGALYLLLFTGCSFAAEHHQLSICAIFRNEAPFLKEWIEFHRLVGVEHFYLCSHNSDDHYRDVLTPYIKKGIVELTEWTQNPYETVFDFTIHVQCGFYNEILRKARKKSRWIAFIDIDEFLFPAKKHKSLIKLLKKYANYGGVAVNWQLFGTSHVEKLKPRDLLIQRLKSCAPKDYYPPSKDANPPTYCNHLIKSIVQPKYVHSFQNPHYANYLPGYYQVNTDHTPFQGAHSPYVQVDQLRINHYWTRDEDYFWQTKAPRLMKWWGLTKDEVTKLRDDLNEEENISIQRYVPRLIKRFKR